MMVEGDSSRLIAPGLLVLPLKTSAISIGIIMKLTSLLGVAVVLLATTAFAHDLTYLGPIRSRETKTVKVDLPPGKLTIEITSSGTDTKFNCQFSASYGIVFEQLNVIKCLGNVVTQSDSSMNVSVTNLGKDSDYRIWVHDTRQ